MQRGATPKQIAKAEIQYNKDLEKYSKVDKEVVKRLRDALDNAVKIATKFNIQPISGVTIVLCCVSTALDVPCTAFKGMGTPRTVKEVGLLLGLMCKYSCEDCKMIGFSSDFQEFELQEGTILHNLSALMLLIQNSGLYSSTAGLPVAYLKNYLKDRTPIDNLIVLSNTIDYESEENSGREFKSFLRKYREFVNPNLLFVSVDLSSARVTMDNSITPEHENDIYLSGYSDQILSFITQRGDSSQLTHVENVALRYDLKEKEETKKVVSRIDKSSIPQKLKKMAPLPGISSTAWRSCRVFISSTFLDMHGERDLLTRFVFPELRARAEQLKVRVYEVDLRWGITKQQSENKQTLGLCLTEAQECDLFVGILGERYGWVPGSEYLKSFPEFQWIQNDIDSFDKTSITELELCMSSLNHPHLYQDRSFFYFRDNSNLARDVLPEYRSHFYHSDKEQSQMDKLRELKDRAKRSGIEVFDNYPAIWGGVVGGVPVAGGLTEFGNRVLNNLWTAIQRKYPEEEEEQPDKKVDISREHTDFIEDLTEGFIGRKAALKYLLNRISLDGMKGGLLFLTGKPGSGKSAVMCQLSQQLIAWMGIKHVISHICGAAPGSTNIVNILIRLYAEISRRFPGIECEIPQDYQELVRGFPGLLRQVSKIQTTGIPLVIILDGLDLLEDAFMAPSLEWLPDPLPQNILIVASAVEATQIEVSLGRRSVKPDTYHLKGLDAFDKQELVQTLFSRYHKKLDEGAFSGEMRVLLSKKESDNPLFLKLACEELRVFGIFEKIGERIKKISQTLPLLLQEILTRLEDDHTRDVIKQALSLIVCSRDGLDEEELAGLIQPKMAPANLQRLARALTDFISSTENESGSASNSQYLRLSQGEARKAVKLRYMKVTDAEKEWNASLSNFFLKVVDPNGDMTWKGRAPRAYRDVNYHLNRSYSFKRNVMLLTDITFLEAKCHSGHALSLLEDFSPPANLPQVQIREYTKFMSTPVVRDFHNFVSSNLHILSRTPSLLLQQAINSPLSSLVQAGEEAMNKLKRDPVGQLALWENKPSREVLEQITIGQQGHIAKCLSVSQDGRFLACGTNDCLIKIYLVSSGEEAKTFVGHSGPIVSLCFSGDVKLCSASDDKTLCLWDVVDGHRVAVLKKHSKKVSQCVAGSNGKQIVSASWDCTACVWNAKTGAFVSQLRVAVRPLNCVALHPDNQLAVFGGWDCNVRMWDTFNQKKLKIMKGHTSAVRAVAYAPSGRHVASAALNGEVKIWSTKAGTQVGSIIGHSLPLTSMCYTPNGQFLVTGSEDCKAKVWSGLVGKPLLTVPSPGAGYALKVKFSPCGQFVLVGYYEGLVCIYTTWNGALEQEIDKRHFAARCLQWSPRSGDSCIVGYDDGVVQAYDTESGKSIKILKSHQAGVHCVAWHPHCIATGAADYTVCLWSSDVRGKKLKADVSIPDTVFRGHLSTVTGVSFSPDGMKLVSVSQDCKLIIWDTLNHKMMQCIEAGHKDWINSCAYSDTGDFVITGSQDFTLKMWNVKEAKDAKEKGSFVGHMGSVNDVAFTNGVVGSACLDGTVKIWTHRGVEITTLHCHKERVNSCDIHMTSNQETQTRQSKVKQDTESHDWADDDDEENDPARKKRTIKLEDIKVATASDDGSIKLWQPFTANEICSISGHGDRIVSLATTPNNQFITSSMDTRVKVWQPELDQENPYESFLCYNAPISSLSFSPKGDKVVITSRETSVSLWDVSWKEAGAKLPLKAPRLTKLHNLSGHERAPTVSCFPTERCFCTAGEDSKLICWGYNPQQRFPKRLKSVQEITMGSITTLGYLATKSQLMVGYWSGKVVVYDLSAVGQGKMPQLTILSLGFNDWVMSMSLHNQELYLTSMDKKLAVVGFNNTLTGTFKNPSIENFYKETDVASKKGRSVKYPKRVFPTQLVVYRQFKILGDSSGTAIAFIDDDSNENGRFKLHDKKITALLLSDDQLVSCGMDAKVRFWRLSLQDGNLSLEQTGEYQCKSPITHATFCPSPHPKHIYILVGDQYGHVNVLNWH